MNDEVIQLFKEQSKKLPAEVRSYLASSNWHDTVDALLGKYQVPQNMRTAFISEISLVLFGMLHPDSFRKELTDRLGGDDPTFDMIVAEIEKEIFSPIRPDLEYFCAVEQAQDLSEDEREAIRKDAEDKKRIDPAIRDAIKKASTIREDAIMHRKRAEAELIVKTEAHNKSSAKSTVDSAQQAYNDAVLRQKTNRGSADEVQNAKATLEISQQVYNASMVVIAFKNAIEMVKRAQDIEQKATDAVQKIVNNTEIAIRKAGDDAILAEIQRHMPAPMSPKVAPQPMPEVVPAPETPAPDAAPLAVAEEVPTPAPAEPQPAPTPKLSHPPTPHKAMAPAPAPIPPPPKYDGPIYSYEGARVATETLRSAKLEGKDELEKMFDKSMREVAQQE